MGQKRGAAIAGMGLRKKETLPHRWPRWASEAAGSIGPLLNTQVRENLRLLLIYNEQVVAG
jgi:hypothetical protein